MKQKLFYCLIIAMTFGLFNVQAQTDNDFISKQKPIKIGDEITVKLRTSHPYQSLKAGPVFEKEFYSKNSTYIKLYFRNFDLAPGDYVEIYSPKTKESIIYAGKGKIVDNGATTISDFWSQVIFSDKVIVKLHTVQASKGYGFDLETVAYGFSPERIVQIQELQRRAICSNDDKERIACYTGTEMFNKAKAVCKLILNGSGSCTGWLLGCEGNIMTNNHCIGNASTARNTDFIFNLQKSSCSGSANATQNVVASSSTFIKTNNSVDATIVKLPSNPTNQYGYLSLRSTAARAGERIYIPQHPGGRQKEIAVKEGSGLAKILRLNGSRDLEYNTDTEPGSSGSPVLDFNTNLVLGIHNTGGCPNGASGGNRRLISWLGSDLPRCGVDDSNTDDTPPPTDEICSGNISRFPYNESFEGNLGAWKQSNSDDLNWTIDANGTPSNGTGPSTAVDGNSYVYLEVSGNGQGFPDKRGILNSPCINLRGVTSPRLKFSYHMIGNAVGNLKVEARINNTGNWTSIFSRTGAQGTNWNQADVALSAYAGQSSVQLRINAVSGNSWQGDIAIDALSITGSSDNPPGDDCGQIDFSSTQITSFSNQDSDGTFEVTGGGTGLILRNNTWKQIPMNYVITANTILQFDFRSTSQGEIHGVGFEDDNTLSADFYFKVHGTQNYGLTNFDNYSGSATRTYTIPVGNFYSGDTDRLVFINDNDGGSGNNSLFSNVRIYEGSCNGSLSAEEVIAQLDNKESLLGNEDEGIGAIKMTPNPTSDQFSLNVSSKSTNEIMVSIYTILGQKKHEARLSPGVNNFSASNLSLSSGIYVVKIQSEGNKDVVKKLIVK